MNIAVNTRFLIKNKLEGIGWFTFETLKRITSNHPEHKFYFLFDRKPDPEFFFSSNVVPIVLPPQARHPILWYIWFEVSVSRFLRKNDIQLFLSTDGHMPLNIDIPSVVVIHDINFYHYPKAVPFFSRFYYNHYFPKFAKKANRIVTVSEYSKRDIADNFLINDNLIDVVYNGVNTIYSPVEDSLKLETKLKYTQGKPYFVFVGALSPRKNVGRLMKAFDIFNQRMDNEFSLVIVGERMFKTKDIARTYNSVKNKQSIVFTGRLQVEELRKVIGSSLAMAYVPYFEGFGIPMLEAMNCHVPLIASDKTSMPEVAGDAALFVDPFSVESIAEAMLRLANDGTLRENLIAKASERKKMFSWDSTSAKLFESLQTVINQFNGK